jgi:hypothetical protein
MTQLDPEKAAPAAGGSVDCRNLENAMPRHARLLLLSLSLGLSAAVPALAQEAEPDPNVAVQDRPRPDYEPLGMRAGSFLIHPGLTIEGAYDDNVFATKNDEKNDVIGILSPRIVAQSDWSRHSLEADAGGRFGFYNEYTGNNFQDFDAGLRGRLDVLRADQLSTNFRIGRAHEDRDSPDDPSVDATRDVTNYYFGTLAPAYRHQFNRMFTVVRGNFRRLDFENAGDVSNQDRDRWLYGGGLRVGYDVSPRFDLFVQGDYRWVKYDSAQSSGAKRDNSGYDARVGTSVDITGLVFGEFSIGYTAVSYDDSEFDDANGMSGDGRITWNVTPLDTIIFNGSAAVEETTVTVNGEDASGNLQYLAGIDVTHELLRNVLLNANATYTRDDFQGVSRTDDTYALGAGVTYLLNRNISLLGTYTFATRDSDQSDEEYDRSIFRIGVNLAL